MKLVPTNTYRVSCRFCTPRLSIVKVDKAEAETIKNAHNQVVHKGRAVAYVEEILV